MIAGSFFIYSNDKFLLYFFRQSKKFKDFSWKAKILLSFICSDVIKSLIFLPFEARKQRLQMSQNFNDVEPVSTMKWAARAYPGVVLRDIIFRVITLGTFLNGLQTEHKPQLKYKLDDIKAYIKEMEKQGKRINYSYFMDYSKFLIKSNFNSIFFNLISCTVIATVITQPLDIAITKLLTQVEPKYKGPFQAIKLIYQEQGIKKLVYSGLTMRISFNVLSALSVLLFFENIKNYLTKYYDEQ